MESGDDAACGTDERRETKVNNCIRRVPVTISRVAESLFYRLGLRIASHPGYWLVGCTIVVLCCLAGLLHFRQEKNPMKLWLPPDSDFVTDTEWLMENLGNGVRTQTIILTGNNVLEPETLLKLSDLTRRINTAKARNKENSTWDDVCFRVPVVKVSFRQSRSISGAGQNFIVEESEDEVESNERDVISMMSSYFYCSVYNSFDKSCYTTNILDLWNYDDDKIAGLSKDEILDTLNRTTISPVLGHPMNYAALLGGIQRDEDGRIVAATAVRSQWFVRVNFSEVDMDKSGNNVGTADWVTEEVAAWETAFLLEAEKWSNEVAVADERQNFVNIWYESARSFADVSESTMFQDIFKLIAGILLMSVYVQLLLSRFNWVEWRFCLTSAGLLCVGGAFIIAVGICSLLQIPYGPVHSSLPFMLMGLGVDDIFVIMASWDQVNSIRQQQHRPLPERIALTLSHAGTAICITSLTDVVAFIIGSSTILPSLQSFCIYAAVGVFVTFVLQITFFIACFTLDTRRVESRRNGMIPCIVHRNFTTSVESRTKNSWRFTDWFYSNIVLSSSGKICVILVTLGIAALGILGTTRLEQRFDIKWFLPAESYLARYNDVSEKEYPRQGEEGFVLMGEFDYHRNFPQILSLTRKLTKLKTLRSLDRWPIKFQHFVSINFDGKSVLNTTTEEFHEYLSTFLFSRSGGPYQKNFRFAEDLVCGEIAPRIKVARMDFKFVTFTDPVEWIAAMDEIKEVCKGSGVDGFVTAWSMAFANWSTDKVIADEVIRNLILALICVMGMTLFLIAEFQTCFWILVCVLLTLLDVCGFLYFWGLTIDIVSCIGLELAVGLSVDYAAHVAHAFLNSNDSSDRRVRVLQAVKHIGAAVLYGAGSTLLALSLLATSEAYVFRSFFKIFLLVIVFGIWHGLIFLPVILSTIGPRSLHETSTKSHRDAANGETVHPIDLEQMTPMNKPKCELEKNTLSS